MIRSDQTFQRCVTTGSTEDNRTNESQWNDDKENMSAVTQRTRVGPTTSDDTTTGTDTGGRHTGIEVEQCGDTAAGCDCCVANKSFLPFSMIQNYKNVSSPNHTREYKNINDHDDTTPKSSSSSSSSVTDSSGFHHTFNHISFEVSPPPPPTKTSDAFAISNLQLGCGPDTSIVIVDSSDDDDNDATSAFESRNSTHRTTDIEIRTTGTTPKSSKNDEHFDVNSSPEAEWDGILLDSGSSSDNASLISTREKYSQSSFIVSSDDVDESENDDDDEVEWNDSDVGEDAHASSIDDDLVRRTKEIIILSSDSDSDKDFFTAKPRRTVATKQRPTSALPSATVKGQLPIVPRLSKVPVESKMAFRKRRVELSQQLLVEFDRMAFGSQLCNPSNKVDRTTVTVTWSNKLRTTAGLTRLSRVRQFPLTKNYLNSANCGSNPDDSVSRIAVIELSCKVIDDETRLRSTLLHEMCHAAAWVLDDVAKPAHGSCFQKWAKRASHAIPDISVTTTHNYEIDFKYKWVCVNYPDRCNVMVQRHSRSINVERQVCGRCKGRLIEVKRGDGNIAAHALSDQQVGTNSSHQTKKLTKNPSAYNEFVRVQAPLVRQMMTTTTTTQKILQSDVMKECARLWKEQQQSKL